MLIKLKPLENQEIDDFKSRSYASFMAALPDEEKELPIPSGEDIEQVLSEKGVQIFNIIANNRIVGGVILIIDETTQHNFLEHFFINADEVGKGYGYATWQAIEMHFPHTKVWETYTPYFEKRNIHFYVNKCGFKIVAFHSSFRSEYYHPDPNVPDDIEFFQFEKIMK